MAKKGKSDVPNPSSIQNRDILQRLNFLYQASTYMGTILPAVAPASGASVEINNRDHSTRIAKKASRNRARNSTQDLSRIYMRDAKVVAQKTMMRM